MREGHLLVVAYLVAIVSANLSVAQFGPGVTVINAFLFIGLDITTRDRLHTLWENKYLKVRMGGLILLGSVISFLLNTASLSIAVASTVAFFSAASVDTVVFSLLKRRSVFERINGSNVLSSAVDSIIFPALAFGFPLLYIIVIQQFLAKVLGGWLWSLILYRETGTVKKTLAEV